MAHPLDDLAPQCQDLLKIVEGWHASGALEAPNSPAVAELTRHLNDLKKQMEQTDRELDAALDKAHADLAANVKRIEEENAAQAAAAAAPKPAPPFGDGAGHVDGNRLHAAISSLCPRPRPQPAAASQPKPDGGDVAAMGSTSWAEVVEPKPATDDSLAAADSTNKRRPRQPKAGDGSLR